MSEETNTAVDTRGRRKERVGQVTSASMDKTITVSVEGVKYHALYKKAMKSTKRTLGCSAPSTTRVTTARAMGPQRLR